MKGDEYMKLLKTSVQILKPEGYDLESLFKHAEVCGRTCYKSEDKITEGSSKVFVEHLISSGHLSVLEHIPIYLLISSESNLDRPAYEKLVLNSFFSANPYSKLVKTYNNGCTRSYVTTNYRVLVENDLTGSGLYNALKYLVAPLPEHHLRVTVKFVTDIGVSREFNRHRVNSPSEQSTRFCNYTKDKFGGVAFIEHSGMNLSATSEHDLNSLDSSDSWNADDWFRLSYSISEVIYNALIKLGKSPQEARRVLPLGTATELVHSAFLDDWYVFLDKRLFGSTGKPHPDAIECSDPLLDLLYKEGLLSDDFISHCKEDYNYNFDKNE